MSQALQQCCILNLNMDCELLSYFSPSRQSDQSPVTQVASFRSFSCRRRRSSLGDSFARSWRHDFSTGRKMSAASW